MTGNANPTTNQPSRRRRYRIAMYGALAVGIVSYIAGLRLELPLVALGVYWAGFLGFVAVWKGSSVTLYDERHERMEAKTATTTVGIIAIVLIAVAPATPALQAAGYALPPLAMGALYGYAGMFGVYGLVYTAVVLRS
ncbi:hypothetical protein [Natronomonas marina]|jgi:hypothetical protein|uniref:hypothetical protein n=1 Tax=Natronomonas marina TaxID=2961939 RepID=UPI0020CA261D|nr:hypothetical protein [Natronomonas marina]